MNINKLEWIVQAIRKRYPSVIAIYKFGSFGDQYERLDSDIDIAVLFPHQEDSVALWEFAQHIAAELNQEIDLIDLKSSSTVFQFQIINTGKRIFCMDEKQCNQFENLICSMYLDFNERRRYLIEDIQERGSIYGG